MKISRTSLYNTICNVAPIMRRYRTLNWRLIKTQRAPNKRRKRKGSTSGQNATPNSTGNSKKRSPGPNFNLATQVSRHTHKLRVVGAVHPVAFVVLMETFEHLYCPVPVPCCPLPLLLHMSLSPLSPCPLPPTPCHPYTTAPRHTAPGVAGCPGPGGAAAAAAWRMGRVRDAGPAQRRPRGGGGSGLVVYLSFISTASHSTLTLTGLETVLPSD
ncbi:hypothetical protein GWK47_001844 [Chionoecetes opilio]|uniref:Uncharacterized protein n=1 Tax=Chionoecetes opilio TaxID=41210 RepID=A0A8J4XTM4_CHIOP|nr:hypothetical protein GWK47_001844 [Chionoecetes opilio]